MIWNMAGDYVINHNLVSERVGKMPEKGLYDSKYAGMSVEDVYDTLEQQQEEQEEPEGGQEGDQEGQEGQEGSQGPGNAPADPGGCGGVMDAGAAEGKDADAHEAAEQKETWERVAHQAATTAARSGGSVGGLGKLVLDNLGEAQTAWEDELVDFASQAVVQEYDWARVDRRFTENTFQVPGKIEVPVGHGALFVDASGSMDDEQLKRIFEEIGGLLESGIVNQITVVDFDTKVNGERTFEEGDDISGYTIHGRGGTLFAPVWEWLEESEEEFDFVVFFTDLYPCDDFGKEPEVPVLWAASAPSWDRDSLRNRMNDVPFGRCIEVK